MTVVGWGGWTSILLSSVGCTPLPDKRLPPDGAPDADGVSPSVRTGTGVGRDTRPGGRAWSTTALLL